MANSDYTVRPDRHGFCPVGYLTADIGPLDSEVTMTGYTSPVADGIRVGMAAMIGDEIVVVTARAGNDLTLGRGCCDTVPAPHSAGDAIWFFDDSIGSDQLEYAGTATIGVKPLPRVTTGVLPIEHSPPAELTFSLRFARPYPPGLVEVNGDPWFTTPIVLSITEPTLEITWAHRDRITQQDQLIDHLEADIGPETGTTYEFRVYREDGTLLRTVVGLTGTSWSYTFAAAVGDFSGAGDEYPGYITLRSMRGGLGSYQQYRIDFILSSSTELAPTCDPYFDDTILLLNCEQPDGSSTFIDTSPEANVVQAVNGITITDEFAAFDGIGKSLLVLTAGKAAWDFGTDDFTIEVVADLASLPALWTLLTNRAPSGGFTDENFIITGNSAGALQAIVWAEPVGITAQILVNITAPSATASTGLHHICLQRVGPNFTLGFDGVAVGTGSNAAPMGYNSLFNLQIGNDQSAAGRFLHGGARVRVTRGVGRYTFPFTPSYDPWFEVQCDGDPPVVPDTTDVALTLTVSLPAQVAGGAIAMDLTQLAAPVSTGAAYVAIFYIPEALLPDPAPAERTVYVNFGMALSQSVAIETVLTYTTTAPTSHADIIASLIAQANAAVPLSSRGLRANANGYTGRPGMQIIGPIGLKLHSTYDVMVPGLLAPVFLPVNNLSVVEYSLGATAVAVPLNQIVTATVSGTPVAGDRFTVTLNATVFSHTTPSGETTSDVATSLAALIDADPNYAATAVGAVITIDGVTPANVFSYAAAVEALFAY